MKNNNNFWCKWLGHTFELRSYYRYFTANGGPIDGIGRHHINILNKCERCGENVIIGKIHGDKEGKIL